MASAGESGNPVSVRSTKRHTALPIGYAARIAFEIDAARSGCSHTARLLIRKTPLDEVELEECARLDDALAEAQRLLKSTVREIMLSRLSRRSRSGRAR